MPLYGLGLDLAQSLRQSGPIRLRPNALRTQETNGPQLPRLLRARRKRPRRRTAEPDDDALSRPQSDERLDNQREAVSHHGCNVGQTSYFLP